MSIARGMSAYWCLAVCGHAPRTVLLCYMYSIMVNHQLLNVDNHYDSLIKYAIIVKCIDYSRLNSSQLIGREVMRLATYTGMDN